MSLRRGSSRGCDIIFTMTTRTIALLRFLLTLALASLVLALLPLVDGARVTAVRERRLCLFCGRSNRGPPKFRAAPPTLHNCRRRQPVLPSTSELSGKLHPTLLKQWLNWLERQTAGHHPVACAGGLEPGGDCRAPSTAAAPRGDRQRTAGDGAAIAGRGAGAARRRRSRPIGRLRSDRCGSTTRSRRTSIEMCCSRSPHAMTSPSSSPIDYRKWIAVDIDPTSTLQLPTSIEWHIQRIRADQVWSALNISGTGVVVANMDTGVDWQHPALSGSYRGDNPKGLPNHLYSWFDATNEQTAVSL